MITCYYDKYGYPRVDPGGLHPSIADFLEQDVQSSRETGRAYLDALDEVEGGRLPEWSGTGNAHHVTIRPDAVEIENVWVESLGVAHLSPDVFRECLRTWEAFMSR